MSRVFGHARIRQSLLQEKSLTQFGEMPRPTAERASHNALKMPVVVSSPTCVKGIHSTRSNRPILMRFVP